jgi:phospholipase/lecithinase/hemolysin
MKKQLVAANFVFLSFILPMKASAASIEFSKLFVFGDSLSDTGNLYKTTKEVGIIEIGLPPGIGLPPEPVYYQGRFSNGKNWVDYLGEDIGLNPTPLTNIQGSTIPNSGINFAFGGSSTGLFNTLLPVPTFPGIQRQVQRFGELLQANNQSADEDALYTIWGGANDYLFSNISEPSDPNQELNPVSNLSSAIESLAGFGAKNIMIFNLPDLGKTPNGASRGNPEILTNLTQKHNEQLAAELSRLSHNKPGINIIPVDVYSLFNRALNTPGEFGLTNVTDSCIKGNFIFGISSVCPNPNEFLFYDDVHPTTQAHRFIADTALSAINAKPVPEPSIALGTLVFGAFGAAGVLRRKRKNSALTTSDQILVTTISNNS